MKMSGNGILKKISSSLRGELAGSLSFKFAVLVACLYSFYVIILAASFRVVIQKSSMYIFDNLTAFNKRIVTAKAGGLFKRINESKPPSLNDLRDILDGFVNLDDEIICLAVMAKTEDERFYKSIDIVSKNKSSMIGFSSGDIVREKRDINYLRQGMLSLAIDDNIYSGGGYFWQCAYGPCVIGKNVYVVQAFISAGNAQDAYEDFIDSMRSLRVITSLIALAVIVGILIITFVFAQNYSALVRRLSSSMKMAALGDKSISLSATGDKELNELAESFNSLISEIADRKKDMVQSGNPMTNDIVNNNKSRSFSEQVDLSVNPEIKELFSAGVRLLRDNRLEEGIAVYRALSVIRPDAHGSYFNLGVAYAKLKDYRTALWMFEKAHSSNPDNELTLAYIAKVKKLLG